MARRLLDAPMAITSDGRLLASVTLVTGEQLDPEKALARALKIGGRVYIGVELTKAESKTAMRRLDDAVAEIVALIDYRERG